MTHSGKKWEIVYSPIVYSDLESIDNYFVAKIKSIISSRLQAAPEIYGTLLRSYLRGYWRLRVGDYRIIYEITDKREVRIQVIGHRKDVYDIARKRLGLF